MQPTNIADPAYFHKVVDCQWACPAHTPVPEYIRLIAQGRYGDAYMVNWVSNVFPGIPGRTRPPCPRAPSAAPAPGPASPPAGVAGSSRTTPASRNPLRSAGSSAWPPT
mgnify:CR=1 FL=1